MVNFLTSDRLNTTTIIALDNSQQQIVSLQTYAVYNIEMLYR